MSLVLAAARGALVLGVAVAAMPLLRRASAATRRSVLVFAFFAIALLPVATAALPALHLLSPTVTHDEADARSLAATSALDPVAHSQSITSASRSVVVDAAVTAAPSNPWLPELSTVVLALWALGAATVLARLGAGLWRARRLANTARSIGVERVGSRTIDVRVSAAIETPAVTGLFVPVILLPRDAHTWDEERRRVVLLHELAHVAQRDCLAHAVAQIACAMHWFNPLAWVAARRLRIERELAADDLVLDAGARPSSYAEHLLALATLHAYVPTGALAMAETSQVSQRIRALLAPGRPRAPLARRRLAALGAFGLVAVSALACATPDPAAPAAPASATDTSGHVQRREGAPLDAIANLTVDPALQAIAEEETDRMTAEWKTRAAVVIVLDPQTGNVLAMTSRSANHSAEVGAQHAITPGSTFKPFVVAAALEEGVIKQEQRFDCSSYGSSSIHDASPNGSLDAAGILAVSSNIGTAKIFDALGADKVGSWTKRFHFAETAPIQLPNVATGVVPSPATVGVAIGEGLEATPIQLAASFAALANGGIYHAPTLVRHTDVGERLVREDTARTVMAMLEGVTGDKGTGKAARVDGVRVAGKTGTAELEADKSDGAYYASFVGAAPLDHPRYVVLVGAEAPRDHGSGGQVAAPVFSRVMKRALAR